METTIDKAGRVVIPVEIRRRLGLEPGTKLEIREADWAVHLAPKVTPPEVVRRRGRRVVVPTVSIEDREPLDVAALIEAERDRWPT